MPVAGKNIWSVTCYKNEDGRAIFGRQSYRPKMLVMEIHHALDELRKDPHRTVIIPVYNDNVQRVKDLLETYEFVPDVQNWTNEQLEGHLLRAAHRAVLDAARSLSKGLASCQNEVLAWDISFACGEVLAYLKSHKYMNEIAEPPTLVEFDDEVMAMPLGDDEGTP